MSNDDLTNYYSKGLLGILVELGIQTKIIDNSIKNCPPFLIGTRIESPKLKTILLYGHGGYSPVTTRAVE